MIQKDIPLRHGEHRWLFHGGESGLLAAGSDRLDFRQLMQAAFERLFATANYFWVHTNAIRVEQRPNAKEPTEICFAIDNVPALESEPLAPPPIAIAARLGCYYGSTEDPAAFWARVAAGMAGGVEEFCSKDGRVQAAIAALPSGQHTRAIEAAYAWVQANIRNVELDDARGRDDDTLSDVDDVIQAWLRQSGRDQPRFLRHAHPDAHRRLDGFHGGHRSELIRLGCQVLAIRPRRRRRAPRDDRYLFYSPGDPYLPPTHLQSMNEGSYVFLAPEGRLVTTPNSATSTNLIRSSFALTVGTAGELEGSRPGPGARRSRSTTRTSGSRRSRSTWDRAGRSKRGHPM